MWPFLKCVEFSVLILKHPQAFENAWFTSHSYLVYLCSTDRHTWPGIPQTCNHKLKIIYSVISAIITCECMLKTLLPMTTTGLNWTLFNRPQLPSLHINRIEFPLSLYACYYFSRQTKAIKSALSHPKC